ncbi:hypothetical protein [Halocalculus aciditolerans]|uniref:DUF3006 family protein n=1 Tax=Halocalculus aciditolerans TaxID=1383812 RepID=A0A830FJJ0_9EURY|nr:hypothetical protein [Halocalculus aciditolerans]GGL58874.1 hypothetical protein GCM10009039_16360 [Halocalculus aciditolerans]
MVADGVYVAVVDCVESGRSRLSVEEGTAATDELEVRSGDLPAEAGPNAVVHVRVEDGDVVDAVYDETETEARRKA